MMLIMMSTFSFQAVYALIDRSFEGKGEKNNRTYSLSDR